VAIKKEVLEKKRRILGKEYLNTILAINNLINILKNQGQLNKAAAIKKEMLEKIRQILGEKHLNTILVINNFASTLKY